MIEKQGFKLSKFNTVLGVVAIFAMFFVVGKMTYLARISDIISILKKNISYQKTFDKIASMLVVYDVKVKEKPLEFIRLGKDYDGGYVVPVVAMESADTLMGYGIADDISFEREFSRRFNKPSFGFDCGIQKIETGDSRCHFFSECIGTSDYLYHYQKSSEQISSFSSQLQRFELSDKRVFIKMDIEGAEFEVIDDILKHSRNIAGMVLEIHISNEDPVRVLKILASINKHFVLVHLHGNNFSHSYFKTKYAKNNVPSVLELTYINKNLLSSYKISKNQKHPQPIDQPNNPNSPECKFEIVPN